MIPISLLSNLLLFNDHTRPKLINHATKNDDLKFSFYQIPTLELSGQSTTTLFDRMKIECMTNTESELKQISLGAS